MFIDSINQLFSAILESNNYKYAWFVWSSSKTENGEKMKIFVLLFTGLN